MRSPQEISEVVQIGARHRSRRVVVYVATGTGPPRVACTAGRRIGGAVSRNRARRVLREAWRALLPKVEAGYRVVLVATKEIEGAKTPDVIEEMAKVLTRAGVLT